MKNTLIITFLTICLAGLSQTDQELVVETVNQNLVKSHIGFLASDELEGRDTPSRGLKIAAKYIESRFIEYGIKMAPGMDSYFQPVPMKKVAPPTSGTVKLGDASYTFRDDFIMIEGDNNEISGDYVYVNYGLASDLEGLDLEGKIVVAVCGDGERESPQQWFGLSAEKREMTSEMGAVALIELYNSHQIPWNFLVRFFAGEQVALDEGGDEDTGMLHLWMKRASNDFNQEPGSASILVSGVKKEKFSSQNVIGFVEGTDAKLKEEIIVYSAHYDHVGIGQADAEGDTIYNGSRDNAIGTVTVLAASQNLGKTPTKRSSLFVLFTGEEKGLLGSKYFVDHSPIALDKMVYCFNSDNGGYNDTSKATIIGLTRTTAEEMIIEACKTFGLEAIEDPAPEQGLFDRSDNVRFASKGIPAPTFSMGFTAFDAEITKYYHQAGDNPNTLDYVYLEKFFRSYVYACRIIGNAEKTPFWIKGDKYYKEGISLYNR